MTNPEQYHIDRFLDYITQAINRGDRGTVADLRHGLADASAHRAWPHIALFTDLTNDTHRAVFMTVGGGMAILGGSDARAGNLGATMRRLALSGGEKGEKALKSFDARFRRLLTCRDTSEVCGRLVSVFRAAQSKSIGINFRQLFWDLWNWEKQNDKVVTQWAAAYWGIDKEVVR